MFKYFKDANTKNELLLEKEREIVEQDNIKIEQQAAELKELNEFQKHFFVNITHELRTPLTLIKGNISRAKKMSSINNIQAKLDGILTHSNKIEHLINDIIDVTKAEASALVLNMELHILNQLIQKQFVAFNNLFESKEINFTFSLPPKDMYVEIDKLYFERVIGNILVNAAKYTSKGGNVTIFITHINNHVTINIEDDGVGIAIGEEEKIFNRFYQIDNNINKANGSGIGLAFCKEVIQLIKGSIVAFQNKEGGATFSITLPKKHSNVITTKSKPPININTEKPTLLLVDDNAEMRIYISSLLTDYNVIEAENGVEALDVLEYQPVNALITDYMMPIMDGYELIKQVKEKKYSFPILVITARADVKSKLDVLALGIDDYLTKPFVEEELVYRLRHSLLNAKNRTQYQKDELTQPQKEDDTVEESELLVKSRSIIEKNIGNPLFGVPELVEAINLTERTLYRKIKNHSGLTPNQFIREIKLLYVRNLVEENEFTTLIQLTRQVGFKNTSHLQKLYKERFGTTISS
jgi:DNA-binding response OmpR family regulator/nitrogen-specific signal transduction histidine kinase